MYVAFSCLHIAYFNTETTQHSVSILVKTMASRFTIYSNKQISYIVYKISSLINKISTLLYKISIIKKISYIENKISVLLY